MLESTKVRSVITGTGHYVPDRVVTNAELVTYVGGSAEWITERTGIVERRWARASQSTSQLGFLAATAALSDAGLDPQDLDALIFATLSPDYMFPGCGVLLQQMLGVDGLPSFDVRNQCSGYLYALQSAHAFVQSGIYTRVLVVGAEIHSAGLDFSEEGRGITVLFGDGAGAVIVERRESEDDIGIASITLGADGSGAESLCCERPGSKDGVHLTIEDLRRKRHFPKMNGRAVFRHAIETLTEQLSSLSKRYDLDPSEVLFVPHQANRRINEHLADSLGIPSDRVVHTIEHFGNTTAASIPMALDVARREGRVQPGTNVVHAAFGSGFTWGSSLVRF